jgi:hypothetical protein
MGLVARPAVAGYVVDTNQKLSPSAILALADATWEGEPIGGVGRYVSISRPDTVGDISGVELLAICKARPGFGCFLVQHVRYGVGSQQAPSGWTPSSQLGSMDGLVARRHAAFAGYPAGCSLSMDLEGVNPTTPAAVVSAHCEAWAESVAASDSLSPAYAPALYDGYSAILTGEELWELPGFHLYWGAPGARQPARRGFALEQVALDVELGGVRVDVSRAHACDALGGRLTWAVWED